MNPVVHFEIPADDMKRAERFYSKVFGWDINTSYDIYFWVHTTDFDEKNMSTKPGEINGAIQKKDADITSTRIGINVADIDDVLKRVLAEGGKVAITKTKLPKSYYSVILDTEDNEVLLIEWIKDK